MTRREILLALKNGTLNPQEAYDQLQMLETGSGLEEYELSEGQKAIWLHQKMNPQTSAYNLPMCLRLNDELDCKVMNQAVQYILDQFPILRTEIIFNGDDQKQKINYSLEIKTQYEDISHIPEDKIIAYLKDVSKIPFQIEIEPLIRFYFFQYSKHGYYLLINVHHLIFDGFSSTILVHNLLNAYNQISLGYLPQKIYHDRNYADFVKEEQQFLTSKAGQSALEYWRRSLGQKQSVLELPYDYKPVSVIENKGGTISKNIDTELMSKISELVKQYNISLSSFFLTAFRIYLYRYTGQEDFCIGMPIMRRDLIKESQLLGYYVNMVALKTQQMAGDPFVTLCKKTQDEIIQAIKHAQYPLTKLVKELKVTRNKENSPLYQAVFAFHNFIGTDTAVENVNLLSEIHQEGEYDFGLEVVEQHNNIRLDMKYNQNLFECDTVHSLFAHYIRLLQDIVKHPNADANELQFLCAEEKHVWLNQINRLGEDNEYTADVLEMFINQVRRSPDSIAIRCDDQQITYGELDEKSNNVADFLMKRGGGSHPVIGIMMPKSIELMIGILAIWKCGAAYLPLDVSHPQDRLAYIVKDSNISFLLFSETSQQLAADIVHQDVKTVLIQEAVIENRNENYDYTNEYKCNDLEQIAYIIYTSGSTGFPKGVMIKHRGLINLLLSMKKEPGFTAEDRMISFAPYGFDMVIPELFLALICGGESIFCSPEIVKHPRILLDEIQKKKPTVMQATSAICMILFESGWKNEEGIKILYGAEPLTRPLVEKFRRYNCDVYNMYGPTETTVWSTTKHIEYDEIITIGKPIRNTAIYILDKFGNLVPENVYGEIYIGGDGLAAGYLNKAELTDKQFVDCPFVQGEKMYRTGDIGRWRLDGNIEFLGRKDFQVKVRGYRIELQEIENWVSKFPDVNECIAVVKEINESKQIIAYFVTKEAKVIEPNELRDYLKQNIPEYMIPSFFVHLDIMPLNDNGKVDRKYLMERELQIKRTKEVSIPLNSIENIVLDLWREVLGFSDISTEDVFFEVGGDSVLAVTLAEKISRSFKLEFNVTYLFKYQNVKEISNYLIKYIDINTEKKSEVDNMPNEGYTNDDTDKEITEYYEDSLAIIGISCNLPGAENYRIFWKNLLAGTESVRRYSKDELRELNIAEDIIENENYIPVQSTIEDKLEFDHDFFGFSPRDLEMIDPQARQLLMHSWKAIEDSGYTSNQIPDTGVYMSSSTNFYQKALFDTPELIENSNEYMSWIWAQQGTIPTMISYKLNLKGPSMAVHSNCSSSLGGLYSAFLSIKNGDVSHALIGASTIMPTNKVGYIYQRGMNFSSNGHVKTFDNEADGMITGEGAAVILVKKASEAVKDKDHIYAVIRGIAMNNDGKEKTGFYAPSVKGQSHLVKGLLDKTKVPVDSFAYIEAHGTGTKLGDPIEFMALSEAYGAFTNKKGFCGIGSVKTNIGHLDTVAGLVGCIKTALVLHNKKIPPTINYHKINKEIELNHSPFYIVDKVMPFVKEQSIYRAGVHSLGVGGSNVHMILENFERTEPLFSAENDKVFILPVSAKNKDVLRKYLIDIYTYLTEDAEEVSAQDLAYTFQTGRQQMQSRVAFLYHTLEELKGQINCFVKHSSTSQDGVITADNKYHADLFDDDSSEIVELWMKKGKYQKAMMFWVNGVNLDFNEYINGGDLRRISAPTYPFKGVKRQEDQVLVLEANKVTEHLVDAASEFEHVIRDVWREVLGIDQIQSNSDFYSMGGDSIKITQIIARLTALYPFELNLTNIFNVSTIAEMAGALETEIMNVLEHMTEEEAEKLIL